MPNNYYIINNTLYRLTASAPKGVHLIKVYERGGVFFDHEEFNRKLETGEIKKEE